MREMNAFQGRALIMLLLRDDIGSRRLIFRRVSTCWRRPSALLTACEILRDKTWSRVGFDLVARSRFQAA
jgi:hypothetical protein